MMMDQPRIDRSRRCSLRRGRYACLLQRRDMERGPALDQHIVPALGEHAESTQQRLRDRIAVLLRLFIRIGRRAVGSYADCRAVRRDQSLNRERHLAAGMEVAGTLDVHERAISRRALGQDQATVHVVIIHRHDGERISLGRNARADILLQRDGDEIA